MLITWLPYADFAKTASELPDIELVSSVSDAQVVYNTILIKEQHDYLHTGTMANATDPCVLMWQGYLPALMIYHNTLAMQVLMRNLPYTFLMLYLDKEMHSEIRMPKWLGDTLFHISHYNSLFEGGLLDLIWPKGARE